jgi:hypothetical protein
MFYYTPPWRALVKDKHVHVYYSFPSAHQGVCYERVLSSSVNAGSFASVT